MKLWNPGTETILDSRLHPIRNWLIPVPKGPPSWANPCNIPKLMEWISYFIPQKYNPSYNQKTKKTTTFFVWCPHPIYPHKLQLHCLGSATQPTFGSLWTTVHPTLPETRLRHQTTCTPRQATLFRGQTCRIHRLKRTKNGAGGKDCCVEGHRGFFPNNSWGILWAFFLKKQRKNQRNCF